MSAYPESYGEARSAFRRAADASGARLLSAGLGGVGAEGETLTIDCAVIGEADAPRALLSVSGVHGAEGFAGSAAQRAFLDSLGSSARISGCKIVLVHALNPWGMSHRSRCDEGNVDLSRNFRSFQEPAPENLVYERIHAAVCPDVWRDDLLQEAGRLFEALSLELGPAAALSGFTGGQYARQDGIGFGGFGPTASHFVVQRLIARELDAVRRLALLEWHTGLGRFGEASWVDLYPPGDPISALTARWCDGLAARAESDAYPGGEAPSWSGLFSEGLRRFLPRAEIMGGPIEFGTVSQLEVFEAVMIDRWLRFGTGPADSRLRRELKARLSAAYDPPQPDWRERVTQTGLGIHHAVFDGLCAG